MNADQIGGWVRTGVASILGSWGYSAALSQDWKTLAANVAGVIAVGVWSHYTNKPGTVIK